MLALILKTIILMEGNSQPNFLTHQIFTAKFSSSFFLVIYLGTSPFQLFLFIF